MRIKRVECDQFAGILGKELEFEKGLNIVLGANESGKSTIADLIYQLLFKDVKLDGRSDTEFIDRYFPKKVSGPKGDVIDGVLVFETDKGTYKLKKEWEKGDGTCRLTMPDGTSIKGMDAIRTVLLSELKHRAGVFSEIVFASQKRNQIAIESIMRALDKKSDSFSDTRADLASTLTKAALETGGVSIDRLEKSLKSILDELGGKWDFLADAPEGGVKRASYKNKWKRESGLIAEAYYEFDEIKSKQMEAENAEKAVETEKAFIREIKGERNAAENRRTNFLKYSGALFQKRLLVQNQGNLNAQINEQQAVYSEWPLLADRLSKAEALQQQKKQAKIHDLFLKAEPAQKEYNACLEKLDSLLKVEETDLNQVRKLQSAKQTEEGKLLGMNVSARIQKLGDKEIEVSSISSGEAIVPQGEDYNISEAVEISVPGVMTMQLMPKGIDVGEVREKIKSLQQQIKNIYDKYKVTDLAELETTNDNYNTAKANAEKANLNLIKILGGSTWEMVKQENETVPGNIETESAIDGRILTLCKGKTVEEFIGAVKSKIDIYTEKYVSAEKLMVSINKIQEDLKNNEADIAALGSIPEEFQKISNPDIYASDLENQIERLDQQINAQEDLLHEAERRLGDKSAEEYADELAAKKTAFQEKKAEYIHWSNIYNKFREVKEKTAGNPVEDIKTKFEEYLQLLTDGGLQIISMDDSMITKLSSGNNALTYDILSEGTRDTITLAFRLAMLEHLFPEGNGLAVFDDPFTDMDPERVDRACRLISKFAENNQVIFITCDGKYKELLDANVIFM